MTRPRDPIGGIWAAVVTPVNEEFVPDAERAIPYYRELQADGCGINLLGTTGEAMSFSTSQRLEFMGRVADALPLDRVMVGTGAAALHDAVTLTRYAIERGFAAALIMPPFFFREATDDGVAAFYEAVFARVRPPARSVLLYNFPKMAGVALHAELVERIVTLSNGAVFGMKDSSNDAQLQSEVLARLPEFAVFPGSEADLLEAKRRGCAGCISGSVALWPQLARRVFEEEDESAAIKLRRLRDALAAPLLVTVRERIAEQRHEDRWRRAMPPLVPTLPSEQAYNARATFPGLLKPPIPPPTG
jgi:4-hydroxy-tetrahydrodipicolinate synthase